MNLKVGSHPPLPDFMEGWSVVLVSLNVHNPHVYYLLQILAQSPELLISLSGFSAVLFTVDEGWWSYLYNPQPSLEGSEVENDA